jgi:hypothetical protein
MDFMAHVVLFSDVLSPGWARSLGPYRLATELRQSGFTTQVVEFYAYYSKKEIAEIINKFVNEETLLVGVHALYLTECYSDLNLEGYKRRKFPSQWVETDPHFSDEVKFLKNVFKLSKKRAPRCKTLIGGGRLPDFAHLDSGADYCVFGQADLAIFDLVKRAQSGSPSQSGIPQVIEADRDFPFHGFNTCKTTYSDSDLVWPGEVLPLEFSRGCIFKCGFCEFPGTGKKKGTFQKTEDVLRMELLDNYERFGVSNYMVMDSTLNDDMEKMRLLHRVVKSLPFKIRWQSYARIDLYTRQPEMITLAKESGCVGQFFGIETFTVKARRMMNKGQAPEQDIATMRKLKEVMGPELNIAIGMIIGLPGDTRQEIQRSFDWLNSGQSPVDSWSVYPLMIDRKGCAPFAVQPAKYGIRFTKPEDPAFWEHETMNLDEATILADTLCRSSCKLNRIGSFHFFRMLNLGYTFEELNRMTVAQARLCQDEILVRIQMKKREYYSKLLDKPAVKTSGDPLDFRFLDAQPSH